MNRIVKEENTTNKERRITRDLKRAGLTLRPIEHDFLDTIPPQIILLRVIIIQTALTDATIAAIIATGGEGGKGNRD